MSSDPRNGAGFSILIELGCCAHLFGGGGKTEEVTGVGGTLVSLLAAGRPCYCDTYLYY